MPGFPPQPPGSQPPKKSRTNAVIIGSAAAVVAAVVITGVALSAGGDGEAKAAPTVTVTKTVGAEDAAEGADEGSEPAAESTDDGVLSLDDTMTYDSDVQISLSSFQREVSGEYASPENTPYIKFTVKIVNSSDSTLDPTSMTVSCAYGQDGKESEIVFDEGIDGFPDTQVLAGRSLSVTWGCELPKKESLLQVEVSPDYEMDTAIFTGKVK
ncbi:hypothetical protein ACIQNG_10155 [Streptomyces sp. NPDC091377]|uniref:hypothetical protein n=1 Tax=Streptomyces sp. NPDC091377 TaxID=3365995 RepID=UPI0038277D96